MSVKTRVMGFEVRVCEIRRSKGQEVSFFSKTVQTVAGAHPASCSMGNLFFPGNKCGRSMKVTTHFHLVARLQMSGAVPLSPIISLLGMDRNKIAFFTDNYEDLIYPENGGSKLLGNELKFASYRTATCA
jgi:hypothetical protein